MLFELLKSFVRVGIGAYGGGVAAIRLIYHEIVEIQGWLSSGEMAEVVALAEMTPGPIVVNAATYTGFRIAGLSGAALATLAVLLPALFFLFCLLALRRWPRTKELVEKAGKLLRPGVVALIVAAVWSMGRATVHDWRSGLFAGASFFLLLFGGEKVHPVPIILAFGLLAMFVL